MEAATSTAAARPLGGEKAQRIIDAMRTSVAQRGVSGSTFDHVARDAGVSRGLLHYYFGTKERLVVEVMRRDCALRLAALDEVVRTAQTPDDFIGLLATWMKSLLHDSPEFSILVFELFLLAQRNEEIAAEFVDILHQPRDVLARVLEAKQAEGVLRLTAPAEAVADVIYSLGDGLAMRMLTEPMNEATIEAATRAARALIADPE